MLARCIDHCSMRSDIRVHGNCLADGSDETIVGVSGWLARKNCCACFSRAGFQLDGKLRDARCRDGMARLVANLENSWIPDLHSRLIVIEVYG